MTDRTAARIVGVLFVVGTVAGALSLVPLPLGGDAGEVLRAVGAAPARAVLGASLILVMGFALAVVPLVAYPVLRVRSEPLALGYVVLRGGLETAIYVGLALIWLVLVPLGRDHVVAGGDVTTALETTTAVLLEGHDVIGHVALTIVFGAGALTFSSALFRAVLVPRWLAGWGIAAAVLVLAAGVLTLVGGIEPGSTAYVVGHVPIAVQEMVLAAWLIVRGFSDGAVTAAPDLGPGS